MSFDAYTWAKAQRIPLPTKAQCARAKAVLKAFAGYVNADGKGWAAIDVLMIESDLDRRTVFRGLSDLKACGLMIETDESEVHRGKVYPIYRLPLDQGPQNTRDRIRQDRELGVTVESPQEAWGDTGDTPRGDTPADLGVTQGPPKQEIINPHYVREDKPSPGAREAAERLVELEQAAPPAMLRFYDRPQALTALLEVVGEGVSIETLASALRRMGTHPTFRSRKHPPQLHAWLANRSFLGWLSDDVAEPEPPARPAAPAFAGPAQLRTDIAAAHGEGFCAAYLDRCAWDGGAGTMTPATGVAYQRLAALRSTFQHHGVELIPPNGGTR